jgi:2-polyprenyl-3-methyl-5-hydroxy-6-metoxy-1,4-benzoquinol methylase
MNETTRSDSGVAAEAAAFNERISERRNIGFVPDIRRAVKSDYFYKSFWRDPHFVRLYLGQMMDNHLALLRKYAKSQARILDVGCGAGYFALELARNGYHVVGADIADKAIAAARETLENNSYTEGFGSLRYEVSSFLEIKGRYDVAFVSGVLHHFSDVDTSVAHLDSLLEDNGVVVAYEPCHERWRHADAAQVALIRGLLWLTGHWYEEPEDSSSLKSSAAFNQFVSDVYVEYVTERDKNETGGQSPNDNSASGDQILASFDRQFVILEELRGTSFIYRLLGGLRGDEKITHRIADFLTVYDEYAVEQGFMQPNGFYIVAKKK